ncbi:YsnF/AvaK domain-containing protein [Tatumella sp. OPLPL6]|uniref:YsnF/AvaK domain-containing protein n=1 Tax=Tatumella sp. OPLPL6 TaxID=1928657 RepID=UPI000C174BEC|nr:YsnF/AvaK domain-containing protein [Tatumella sp. OPLPL6]PIJ45546.1 hypothetical protein BOM24_02915 [Tatumella sp. OPLPL6]
MSSEKIVTLFDTVEHAQAAERNLIKADFKESDISVIHGRDLDSDSTVFKDTSIWKRLFGNDVEEEHAELYSEALHKNGAVLTVVAHGEDEHAKALAILNRHQLVDVPAKARGTETAAAPDAATPRDTRPHLTGNETKDEILQLAKEELEVGKRLVKEGTTRIRRYVTTEDVSQKVNLREQHAEVVRNTVNRPVTGQNIDWSEKSVVVDELAEKPVVNKTAHVVEEVVVKKVNTNHDEEIKDTVRQQHAEVERLRNEENLKK